MEIDPRLLEGNADESSNTWLSDKLTVIVDVWIAEYLKQPHLADGRLRQNGFTKLADRLVEIFGEGWWVNLGNPSVGAISQALRAHDEKRTA